MAPRKITSLDTSDGSTIVAADRLERFRHFCFDVVKSSDGLLRLLSMRRIYA
jgi:hypothetical protein